MMNPVVRREAQTLMRSFRTFLAIMIYVGILLLVAFAYISVSTGGFSNSIQPMQAIEFYRALGAFQLGLAMIMAPIFAGASISGERERQTLDLMLVTKMSGLSIITGKLISSLLIILLMIVASLPVYAIILYYGGVSLFNLFSLILFTLLMASLSGSIAIFFSAWTRRTIVSIVISIIITLAITIGNLIIMLLSNLIYYNTYEEAIPIWINRVLTGINPGFGYFSFMDSLFGSSIVESIINSATNYLYKSNSGLWGAVPIWTVTCVFAAAVSIICVISASKCLKTKNMNRKKA